jgi:mono/diheme cytochrome c family protein
VWRSCWIWLALLGCTEPSDAQHYVEDRDFRRSALVAQLVSPDNQYSRERLAHYATTNAGSWDDLPVWNPPVSVVGVDQPPRALDVGISPDDAPALRELGERAFYRYPVQLWPSAQQRGLWTDREHGSGGLVRVETGSGPFVAATCATCHAMPRDGALVPGLANAMLDLGWGPGRLDVTTLDGREPVKIPDLRPVRWLGYVHADATVLQRDPIALAIRIETLIITSHHATIRPPPVVALALAQYLWSLAPPPPDAPASEAAQRGAAVFATRCASCHSPPGFTGKPVSLARVGTDPAVGLSRERGTGMYRVPSLRGVADRAWLLHDGSVRSLAELLDPARVAPGHRFGTSLSAADRSDLVAYLVTL